MSSPSWGDATTWQLRNASNVTVLNGGPYGNGYNQTLVLSNATNGPFSLVITSTLGDNFPNYSVSVNGVVQYSGTAPANQTTTIQPITCAPQLPPPANPTSITASTNTLCSSALAPVTLTANGASGTVYWFTGSCGTSGQFATGNSVVVNPSSTTTYFARNFNGSEFSAACASTTVTVTNVPAITIAGNTNICAGQSTTLTASGGGTGATLANVLAAINTNSAALIASIPTPSGFNMDNGVNGNSINDGCSDMYDGGNFINTNIAGGIFYSDNAVIPSASFGSGGQYFTRY
jgi:hypothetical protein